MRPIMFTNIFFVTFSDCGEKIVKFMTFKINVFKHVDPVNPPPLSEHRNAYSVSLCGKYKKRPLFPTNASKRNFYLVALLTVYFANNVPLR